MADLPFKVGDIVEVRDDYPICSLFKETQYKIVECYFHGGMAYVRIDGKAGTSFYARRFKLVSKVAGTPSKEAADRYRELIEEARLINKMFLENGYKMNYEGPDDSPVFVKEVLEKL